jgi:hypothetical protein
LDILSLEACGRHNGAVQRLTVTVMDSSLVIDQVPFARETVPRQRPFAFFERTREGFLAMPVHAVSFALVPEKARGRRKLVPAAGGKLASIGLQVRVDVFMIVALQSLGTMSASLGLQGAVV